jgi:Protein of unknown function (DUF2442)
MTTLVLEREPRGVRVEPREDHLAVTFDDGRVLSVPLEWYPRLLHGTDAERRNCELFGDGTAIEWPDLDEHISVEGLLAGRRSGECAASFERWLASRGHTS